MLKKIQLRIKIFFQSYQLQPCSICPSSSILLLFVASKFQLRFPPWQPSKLDAILRMQLTSCLPAKLYRLQRPQNPLYLSCSLLIYYVQQLFSCKLECFSSSTSFMNFYNRLMIFCLTPRCLKVNFCFILHLLFRDLSQ